MSESVNKGMYDKQASAGSQPSNNNQPSEVLAQPSEVLAQPSNASVKWDKFADYINSTKNDLPYLTLGSREDSRVAGLSNLSGITIGKKTIKEWTNANYEALKKFDDALSDGDLRSVYFVALSRHKELSGAEKPTFESLVDTMSGILSDSDTATFMPKAADTKKNLDELLAQIKITPETKRSWDYMPFTPKWLPLPEPIVQATGTTILGRQYHTGADYTIGTEEIVKRFGKYIQVSPELWEKNEPDPRRKVLAEMTSRRNVSEEEFRAFVERADEDTRRLYTGWQGLSKVSGVAAQFDTLEQEGKLLLGGIQDKMRESDRQLSRVGSGYDRGVARVLKNNLGLMQNKGALTVSIDPSVSPHDVLGITKEQWEAFDRDQQEFLRTELTKYRDAAAAEFNNAVATLKMDPALGVYGVESTFVDPFAQESSGVLSMNAALEGINVLRSRAATDISAQTAARVRGALANAVITLSEDARGNLSVDKDGKIIAVGDAGSNAELVQRLNNITETFLNSGAVSDYRKAFQDDYLYRTEGTASALQVAKEELDRFARTVGIDAATAARAATFNEKYNIELANVKLGSIYREGASRVPNELVGELQAQGKRLYEAFTTITPETQRKFADLQRNAELGKTQRDRDLAATQLNALEQTLRDDAAAARAKYDSLFSMKVVDNMAMEMLGDGTRRYKWENIIPTILAAAPIINWLYYDEKKEERRDERQLKLLERELDLRFGYESRVHAMETGGTVSGGGGSTAALSGYTFGE